MVVSIPNNKMAGELVPTDLELNQEYNLTFHTDCDERNKNIKQLDGGIYTLKDILTYYTTTTTDKLYYFINIDGKEINLSYITDKSLFRLTYDRYIFCCIELSTNEYVLK
jgi:hypothetical protein